MASQAISLMSQARGRLILKQVFWAAVVLSLPMVESDHNDTAWTDGRTIGFNPKFIQKLGLDVIIFVIAHEAAHVMFMHATRRGVRDPKLWNIAADYAINILLKESGFTIWDQACAGASDKRDWSQFKGKSAEQIYDLLKEEADKNGGKGAGSDGGKLGGDLVYKPMDASEVRALEQDIKAKIVQAATQAQLAGQMPAHLKLLIDGIVNPPQRWQDVFRAYMRQPAAEIENWTRRNRRYRNVIMPGRFNYRMGELVIIGDTSGSMMCANIMGQLDAEIQAVAEQLKPTRTRVIWADDADCSLQQVFEWGQKIKLQPQGGGGTDMRKPLKFVERYNPLVVLLLTDGYTPWPSRVPYPLVVGCVTDVKAPIGRTVHIPDPNAARRRKVA